MRLGTPEHSMPHDDSNTAMHALYSGKLPHELGKGNLCVQGDSHLDCSDIHHLILCTAS